MDDESKQLEEEFRAELMTIYGEDTPLQIQELMSDFLDQGLGYFEEFLKLGDSFNRNKTAVGRIIALHLLMEDRIDHVLKTLIPGYHSRRYKCWQKIMLLPESGYLYTPLISAMFEFSEVRNHFGHQLDATLEEKDIPLINILIDGIEVNERFETRLDLTSPQGKVEFFAKWVCGLLLFSSEEVITPYKTMIEKYPKLEGRFEAMKRCSLPEEYKRYKLTLHDAMIKVLLEQDDAIMEAGALADVVHSRKLYWKKNGEKAPRGQILARARMYKQFEIEALEEEKHIKLI